MLCYKQELLKINLRSLHLMLFTAQSHLLFSGTVSAASQLFFRIICVCVCVDEDYTSVHLQQ